jgi:hypothetical protein
MIILTHDLLFPYHLRDKDILVNRIQQYINAVQSARVTSADVNYDEHHLLAELRLQEQKEQARSLGNGSLDKFTHMYKEPVAERDDEYSGEYPVW